MLEKRMSLTFFFFQAEDGIRDYKVTGVQTCALPISDGRLHRDFEHLPRDELLHLVHQLAAALVGAVAVHDHRQRIHLVAVDEDVEFRSEERRVGKECRSRWSPYH